MDIPQHLLAKAMTFCSIQPCIREAEGEFVIEQEDGEKNVIPVCARHYEYYVQYFGGEDFDPTIISKETVFADEVADDGMIEQIVKHGELHEIVT